MSKKNELLIENIGTLEINFKQLVDNDIQLNTEIQHLNLVLC